MREMTTEKAADEIRRAYGATAAGRPNEWMTIAHLRDMVDLNTDEITDAIKHLNSTDAAFHVIPESNQKVLTDRERDAEVIIGNQRRHLIAWIR